MESHKRRQGKAINALAVLANLIKDISILIQPVMPKTAEEIHAQINYEKGFSIEALKEKLENHEIGEPKPLFQKLEDKKLQELKEKYSGKQEKPKENTLSKIDLRIARIISVNKHPEADKLYIEKIDVGGETRTIISGLVGHYTPEELIGKNVVLAYNLKPAKIRGIESHGMLLAVQQGKKVGILHCPKGKPGERITIEGIKQDIKQEISIDEFFKAKLEATEQGIKANGNPLKAPKPIIVDKGLKGKIS